MPRYLGTICSPSLLRKCCNLSCGFKGSSQLNVKTEERLSGGRLKFSLICEPARCSPCSEKSLQFNKRVGARSLGVPGVFLGHTRSYCSSPFLRCAEPVSPAAAPRPLSLHSPPPPTPPPWKAKPLVQKHLKELTVQCGCHMGADVKWQMGDQQVHREDVWTFPKPPNRLKPPSFPVWASPKWLVSTGSLTKVLRSSRNTICGKEKLWKQFLLLVLWSNGSDS